MSNLPPDYHIQHEEPPIFYCWKYWLTTGEMDEGCTSLKVGGDSLLDLNQYGWVYITVPVLGLFLLVFLFYCFCRGKSAPPSKQPLISEVSDSEEEYDQRRPPRKSYAVPVRKSDAKNYYTVVPIEHGNPRKVPLKSGVDPTNVFNQQQQKQLYPRLSVMRQNGVLNGKDVGKKPAKISSREVNENEYQPDPSSVVNIRGASAPPPHNYKQHEDDTSSEESEEEQ